MRSRAMENKDKDGDISRAHGDTRVEMEVEEKGKRRLFGGSRVRG